MNCHISRGIERSKDNSFFIKKKNKKNSNVLIINKTTLEDIKNIKLKAIERVNRYQKLLRLRKFEELKAIQRKKIDINNNSTKESNEDENEDEVLPIVENEDEDKMKEIKIIKGFLTYSFNYVGIDKLTEELVKSKIPIIECEYFEVIPTITFIENYVLVEIETNLKDLNYYPDDFGITFDIKNLLNNDELCNFYNNYTNNLILIGSENCPFSKVGNQFKNIKNVEILDAINPYFLKETSLKNCFNGSRNFNSNISNWDTTNVIDMSYMFNSSILFNNGEIIVNIQKLEETHNCSYIDDTKILTCPNAIFNTSLNANDILIIKTANKIYSSIVQKIKSNSTIILLNSLGKDLNEGDIIEIKKTNQGTNPLCWNTSNVLNMESMFRNACLFSQDLNFDVSNVINMSNMFYKAITFNKNLNNWQPKNVIDMSCMFFKAENFNNGEINNTSNNPLNWDISSCEDIHSIFENCSAFNQYIGDWNVCKVKNMEKMFKSCILFNQYIGAWNTVNLENISEMFNFASSFNNGEQLKCVPNILPLLSNYVDKTKTLNCPGGRFTIDLSNNDILIVKTCRKMTFHTIVVKNIINNTTILTSNNIGNDLMLGQILSIQKSVIGTKPLNWNTSNIKNTSLLFNEALSFNQDISKWDISQTNNTSEMFNGDVTFNNGLN